MRVILDISTLGLGELHPGIARGGLIRVDEHLVEELAASGQCELAFCANHSSLAYDGVLEYLRTRPSLSDCPLLGPPHDAARTFVRHGLAVAYRRAHTIFPLGLPRMVRSGGQRIDRKIHPPVVDRPGGADVFHSTHVPLPPRPRLRSPQRFLTIYDLRHRRFPQLYDARTTAVAEAILHSVGPEDWVITSSEASRGELIEFGVAEPHHVFVVPLAADRHLFHPCRDGELLQHVRGRYGIGDAPYILSVNSIDVRKNMHQAIRAFTRLVRQERLGGLQLVIAGSAGSGSSLMTDALAEAADARGRIVQAGFVEDADLAALYSGALGFLYPSFYEGFGLPPLEAMQCGTPVITSNASSLPEVVGEAGMLVPPDDLDALCAAMLELVTKPGLRTSLQEKSLARAAGFSWQKTATAVVAAYRAALETS